MLAPPKRVGFRPNRAFLRCPHPVLHCTFLRTSRLPALRADVTKIYPALALRPSIPPSGLPWPHDLPKPDEAKQGAVRARKRRREAGCSAQPPCVTLCVTASKFQGQNCAPAQSPTMAPTPRFRLSEAYGCHPTHRMGTQALTGADTGLAVLGCSSPAPMDGHWQKTTRQKSAALLQMF